MCEVEDMNDYEKYQYTFMSSFGIDHISVVVRILYIMYNYTTRDSKFRLPRLTMMQHSQHNMVYRDTFIAHSKTQFLHERCQNRWYNKQSTCVLYSNRKLYVMRTCILYTTN